MEKLIEEYPLLANDPDIQALERRMNSVKSSLIFMEKEYADKVTAIQKNCPHDGEFYYERAEKPLLSYSNGNLLSKTCTACGFKPEKPRGPREKICAKCWGEMKYLGKSPGQGGDGEHHYECKQCRHHHTHT